MPDCPKCKVIIALSEIGPICPECMHRFSPMELHKLPDYNFYKASCVMEAFIQLMDLGRIDNQLYYMELLQDGFALLPLGIRFSYQSEG